jgi:hypothetical protein
VNEPENKERIPIDDLEFSVRTENVLKGADIFYIDQLLKVSLKDMLEWRNCGKKSIFEVREKLSKYGLALKGETANPEVLKVIIADLPKFLRYVQEQVNEPMKELRYFSYKIDQLVKDIEKR